MKNKKKDIAPWAKAYRKDAESAERYRVFFDADEVKSARYKFVDELVEETANLFARDAMKLANISDDHVFSGKGGEAPLTLDLLENGDVRIKPLDYKYYFRFYQALDKQVKLGSRSVKTLRSLLAPKGKMHQIDSDVAPSKFGMAGLIVTPSHPPVIKALQGLRSRSLAFYANTLHCSFSGGVEVQDLSPEGGNLADVIKAAAIRECKEELDVELTYDQIDILGVWRDSDRLNAQSFVVIRMDDISNLTLNLNSETVWMKPMPVNIIPFLFKILRRKPSPELEFFWKILR